MEASFSWPKIEYEEMCNEYMLQIGKRLWHLSAAYIPEMNLKQKKKKVLCYVSKCWAKFLRSKIDFEDDCFQLTLGLNTLLDFFF